MRVIGMDIHRTFAEAVMIDGDKLTRLGRANMSREHPAAFAARLTHEDHIVVEATGNGQAVVEAVAPFVGRIVIANLRQVHLIAKARIKTDVIDATVLGRLYASGFLPEVWVKDQRTMSLRLQVTRRNQVVRQRVRLKTMIQAILHAHLVPRCPHADIAGPKGRAWLLAQMFPGDETSAIERLLREYDRLSILYDNSTITVAKICSDRTRERTRTFNELVSHYLFRDRFVRPARGNNKGKVEGLMSALGRAQPTSSKQR